MFDVAHGAGLAAIWASWARSVMDVNPKRFAQYAKNVMQVAEGKDDTETALAGIAATENFFKEIGMPTCIRELGISLSDAQIDELSEKCTFFHTRTIGGFKKLDYEDIRQIYRKARS